MAKNKEPSWITCNGYTLDARLGERGFTFKLIVGDNDYSLDQKAKTGLIQHVLRVMADRWPAWDWEFQADDEGTITDIR